MPVVFPFAVLLVLVAFVLALDDGLTWLLWRLSGLRGARPRSSLVKLFTPSRHLSLAGVVVTHLATAVRLNLPLDQALEAAAREERGRLPGILRRMARSLSQGQSVSTALDRASPACPAIVISMVRAGERTHRLAQALTVTEALIADRQRRASKVIASVYAYPVAVLAALTLVLTHFLVVVVPRFKDIFTDFDVPLPRLTAFVIEVMDVPPAIASVVLPFLAILLVFLLVLSVRPRQPERPRALSIVRDTVRWWTPVLHHLDYCDGIATCLDVMVLAMRGGMPLDISARAAAGVDVNIHVRRTFEKLGVLVGDGMPPGEAARTAGLPPVVVTAFRSTEGGATAAHALDLAAACYRAHARRGWHILVQFVNPAVTVAAAVIVGTVVVAVFLPLVVLTQSVLSSVE